MERVRSVLRNSFRFSKREKRGAPITADSAEADSEHDEFRHGVTSASNDLQNPDSKAVRNGVCAFVVKYYG